MIKKKQNRESRAEQTGRKLNTDIRQLPEAEGKIIIRVFKKGLQKNDHESVSTNNRGNFNL